MIEISLGFIVVILSQCISTPNIKLYTLSIYNFYSSIIPQQTIKTGAITNVLCDFGPLFPSLGICFLICKIRFLGDINGLPALPFIESKSFFFGNKGEGEIAMHCVYCWKSTEPSVKYACPPHSTYQKTNKKTPQKTNKF